jgi:type II secretory ATPase GspE/PulE/Tfp pilus assembly ATPase PilB-like protein
MDETVAPWALDAALDECLVVAQIRGRDAADAVARLAAQVPRDLLAKALRGVLAQRLVRTVCLHCRVSHEPPAALRRRIAETFGPVQEYVKGRGCSNCFQTGFYGRIGLYELVTVDDRLAGAIRRADGVQALREAFGSGGRPTIWSDGINKIRAGITSLEEVMRALAGCPGGLEGAPTPAEHLSAAD